MGLAAGVLPICKVATATWSFLASCACVSPSFRRMSRISNSGASDWVGGANSGSSAITRSMSASVRLSNFSAFACRSGLRVIIKASHSTGPASPK